MPPLEFHEEAAVDYLNAIKYLLVTEGRQKAEALHLELQEQIEACQANPHVYRTVLGDVRRIGLVRFHKHDIAFAFLDDRVQIIAIGHASRREFFWRNRLQDMIG